MHLNDITARIHFMVSDPNKEIGNYFNVYSNI